jgi:hypothetical protein
MYGNSATPLAQIDGTQLPLAEASFRERIVTERRRDESPERMV